MNIYKKFLSTKECNEIIQIGNKYTWSGRRDSIDALDEQQINIYTHMSQHSSDNNKELLEYFRPFGEKKLPSLLDKIKLIKPPYFLDWFYLRKYEPIIRDSLMMHKDNNYFTVNIFLNNDFEGGEYYLFDNEGSVKSDDAIEKLTPDERKLYVDNHASLPIVSVESGDLIWHFGEAYHGVKNITKGERYTLILFFKFEIDMQLDSILSPGFQTQLHHNKNNKNQITQELHYE
jgi:hypothetical protein